MIMHPWLAGFVPELRGQVLGGVPAPPRAAGEGHKPRQARQQPALRHGGPVRLDTRVQTLAL